MRRTAQTDLFLPRILRETMVALIRHDGPDLTSRQFAVFMVCYVEDGPHTVRGLAERTRLSKPAISRVLNRLGALGLTRRVADPTDKRSVLISRTEDGSSLYRLVRDKLAEAATTARPEKEESAAASVAATG